MPILQQTVIEAQYDIRTVSKILCNVLNLCLYCRISESFGLAQHRATMLKMVNLPCEPLQACIGALLSPASSPIHDSSGFDRFNQDKSIRNHSFTRVHLLMLGEHKWPRYSFVQFLSFCHIALGRLSPPII